MFININFGAFSLKHLGWTQNAVHFTFKKRDKSQCPVQHYCYCKNSKWQWRALFVL